MKMIQVYASWKAPNEAIAELSDVETGLPGESFEQIGNESLRRSDASGSDVD